jgi:hypothetical protein
LRTLEFTSTCPECNHPVQESIIDDAELKWLRRIRRGLSWLIATRIWGVLLMGLYLSMSRLQGVLSSMLLLQWSEALNMIVGCLALAGSFMVTRYSRYLPAQNLKMLGTVTRVLLVISLILDLMIQARFLLEYTLGINALSMNVALQMQLNAFARAVGFAAETMLIFYIYRFCRKLQTSVRTWCFAAISGAAICLLLTEIHFILIYQSYLQTTGGPYTGPSPLLQSLYVLNSAAHLVCYGLVVIFYSRCRAGLTAIIAGR